LKEEMQMKKLLVVFFTCVLVFGALGAAFAADKQHEVVDTSRYKKDPPWVVGYDIYWLGNTWSAQFAEEFKQAAAMYDQLIADTVITSSEGSVEKQIKNIEAMIAKKVDIIIITPNSTSGLAPVIAKALRANIPVVLNAAPVEGDEYTTFINVTDKALGRAMAEWLVDQMNGRGRIFVINGLPGLGVAEARWEGAEEVFRNYPRIKVVMQDAGDWSVPKTKRVVSDMLAAYPRIDGVWGDAIGHGIMEAFEEAGARFVPTATASDNNGFLKYWAENKNEVIAIGVTKPVWLSRLALDQAFRILQGLPVFKDNYIPPNVVTKENVEEFVRWDLPDGYWTFCTLSDKRAKALFGQ
jgi:ribose transport system substrate-binding protein